MRLEEQDKRKRKKRRKRSLTKKLQHMMLMVTFVIFFVSAGLYLAFSNVLSSVLMTISAQNAAICVREKVSGIDGFEELVRSVMDTFASVPEEVREQGGEAYYSLFSEYENNEAYKKAVEQLSSACEDFLLEDVFIAMFSKEEKCIVYILDPVDGGSLNPRTHRTGDWKRINQNNFSDTTVSFDGKDIRVIETESEDYGQTVISSKSLYNSDGKVYALALAEVPKKVAMVFAIIFTVFYFVILLFVVFLIVTLARMRMKAKLIKPIRLIADAAENYVENKVEGKNEASFKQLNIRTGDELEELSLVMAGMEADIAVYEEDLMKATAEKQRISTELDLATRIQGTMLPQNFPDRTEFSLYARMDPAKEVGGDFYDFFMVDEKHLCLVIADVSGKGIPAALFMMMSRIMLKNFALTGLGPKDVLQSVNTQICDNNKENMFVTVWIGILDLESGHLIASNAGHEYPVIKKPSGLYNLIKDRHGLAVGAIAGARYSEYELILEPGTTLFIYTDGLPEATDENEVLFGNDRMLDTLNGISDDTPSQILEEVTRSVSAFAGDAPQFDDLTMLCLTFYGPEGKSSIKKIT